MQRARGDGEPGHDFFAMPAPERLSATQKVSTARDGWPLPARLKINISGSWLVLSFQVAKSFLCFLYVFQGELAGLNEMAHHRLRAPYEKSQQVVDQPSLGSIARDR